MAKVVYLLRHAKSSWADPGLDDADRPLAPRGEEAADALGPELERRGIAPQLVLCSPARRARQTLDRARRGLPKETRTTIVDRLYGAGPGEILDMLRVLPDDVDAVMVVGHNPVLQELALALSGSGAAVERVAVKFPTGAVAELSFPAERWTDLQAGGAELSGYLIPKDFMGKSR